MAEPVFKLSQTEPSLYFLTEDKSRVGPRDYTIAFFSEDNPDSEILTLFETWQKKGCFVFLKVACYGLRLDFFIESLRTVLEDQKQTRFIWIENPNDRSVDWIRKSISTEPGDEGDAWVSKSVSLKFRNFALKIPGRPHGYRCFIKPESPDRIIFAAAGDEQPVATFTAGWGEPPLGYVGEHLVLPFDGERFGCLQFELTLQEQTGSSTKSDLDLLDVGCRLFFSNPSGPPNSLKSLRYPVFRLENDHLSLLASLDPLYPIDPDRTCFEFLRSGGSGAGPLSSFFRTPLGQPIILTPTDQPEASRLVFAPCPGFALPQSTDPYYLVPCGAFDLGVEKTGPNRPGLPERRLMCGLCGLEYFGLGPESGWKLIFLPGSPAYLGGFQPEQKTVTDTEPVQLNALATTAWVYICSPTGDTAYYAQPEDAVLYAAPESDPVSDSEETRSKSLLEYLEVPAGRIFNRVPNGQAAAANVGKAFPMLPMAGLAPCDAALGGIIEKQVISMVRRRLIFDIDVRGCKRPLPQPGDKENEPAANDLIGTTPQGLQARFSSDRRVWKQITFARDQAGRRFLFQGLVDGSPLKMAFQTNRLFLVISSGDAIIPHLPKENSTLFIGDWEFDFDPEKWADCGTILVFKLFKGKSLFELARNPTGWTQAETFNRDKKLTGKKLLNIIQTAVTDSQKGVKELRSFVDHVVNNRNWTGILVFNCRVPPLGLPPQLAGLAAGIEPSQFYAHHFGISTSPVVCLDGRPDISPSALFGLIDYRDPNPLAADGPDLYRFKVSSLKVLFRNSNIADFSSQIMLGVTGLFGEAIQSAGSGQCNTLLLSGSYQKHNDQEAYVFQNEEHNRFQINSHVLEHVEIRKAQFVTTSPPRESQQVRTRFYFWGSLRFNALKEFDVFSFGSETDRSGALRFAGLTIAMAFDAKRPDQKIFSFDAGQMTFDMNNSIARPGSLFSRFPLKLIGLLQSKPGTKPEDLGYLPVTSPLKPGFFSSPSSPWFGLKFELDLGGPGALASEAGITTVLLSAWESGTSNVFIGMKLPSTAGAIGGFDIEGVLKLSMRRIEFLTTGKGGILLKFRNITLNLMGKAFPPKGHTDLWLFSDPEEKGSRTLGWYAAYVKDMVSGKK